MATTSLDRLRLRGDGHRRRRASARSITAPADALSQDVAVYRPFGALRFALALVVAFDHCRILGGEALAAAVGPWVVGNLGVFSFFILSGFIIADALRSYYAGRTLAFLANRLLRLIPPYVAAVLVSIAVHAWLSSVAMPRFIAYDAPPAGMYSARNLAINAVLPFAWYGLGDVGLWPDYPFVRYAWAISVEFWFYGYIAVCYACYRFIAAKFTQGVLAWGLRRAAAVAGFVGVCVLYDAFWSTRWNWLYPFYYGPYFALGVALYYAVRRRSLLGAAGVAVFGTLVFRHYIPYSYSTHQAEVGAWLLLGMVPAAAVLDRLRLSAPWQHWDRRLGDLSYPLYLNHYAVSILFLSLCDERRPAVLVGCLVASILVAIGLTQLVEPLTRSLRDRFRGAVLR